MKSSRLIVLLVALMLLTGLVACGSGSSSTQTPSSTPAPAATTPAKPAAPATPAPTPAVGGGTIQGEAKKEMVDNVVVVMGSATFDPAPFGSVGGRGAFSQMLYANLVYRNHFSEAYYESDYWIAKDIVKVDDVTYEIEIWDNIKDNQGNVIDVDDIIWNYEMLGTIGEQLFVSTSVASMENIGNNKLRMKLAGPLPGTFEMICGYNRIGFCDRQWWEKATPDERANNPAVTGPYYIKSITPGADIVLQAVENYWMPQDKLPKGMQTNVKTITMKTITEAAMRSIALENKEVDCGAIAASEYDRFFNKDGTAKPGYNVKVTDTDHHNGFFLNMDKKSGSVVANNVNLRRAILTMIKWEDIAMCAGNTLNTVIPCYTNGVTDTGGFLQKWKDEPYWPYDVNLAKQYMAESGIKGDVTIRFLTRVGSTYDAINSVLIESLGQIGVKLDIIAYDQATFNNFKFDATHYDIIYDSQPNQHVANGWDYSYNPKGFKNGGMNFLFAEGNDYQYGLPILYDCLYKTTPETIDAFHKFLIESACCKSVYVQLGFRVAQEGILEICTGENGTIMPSGFVFADNYKSVIDK